MKTKRIMHYALLMAFMIVMAAVSVSASYVGSGSVAVKKTVGTPNVQLLMTKYDPFPVGPGEYVDVWLKIGNEEEAEIKEFTFELLEEFPFSLDSNENPIRYFGRVNANSIQTLHFKVRVDENAVEGENKLKFRYRYINSDTQWIYDDVKIQIQTREAIISVESVEISDDYLVPGKETIVKVTIKNLAQSMIRDIGFKLDLTMESIASNPRTLIPSTAVIDSYFNALPFVPVNSASEKRIAKLEPGETATFEYTLRTFADAKSKTYKVPVIINFKDELTNNFTKQDIIGLMVGAEPDLSLLINSDTIYSKGTGTVEFRIVNKGVNDVRFLSVYLDDSEAFDMVSANQVYIGDIDSDDYETAEFKINVKKLNDKKIILPVRLVFKDANNKEYSQLSEIDLTAYSLKERGMGGSSGLSKVIIILLLMVGGYFGYKHWEKSKKNKKK